MSAHPPFHGARLSGADLLGGYTPRGASLATCFSSWRWAGRTRRGSGQREFVSRDTAHAPFGISEQDQPDNRDGPLPHLRFCDSGIAHEADMNIATDAEAIFEGPVHCRVCLTSQRFAQTRHARTPYSPSSLPPFTFLAQYRRKPVCISFSSCWNSPPPTSCRSSAFLTSSCPQISGARLRASFA
jgi:hypothetical protein